MDRDYHIEWNKSDVERQIPYMESKVGIHMNLFIRLPDMETKLWLPKGIVSMGRDIN